ncbi:hypothetical protein RND71_019200 [Anisodus tanguticus]|uniref:Uncharacterized protein n=1 Tax=Anisodus tanguticus TaxID=243964 RepID=A0AAE1V899_9SOLA|nr:hypothetical protein RND71_019200 [Anisodus tanguticus]
MEFFGASMFSSQVGDVVVVGTRQISQRDRDEGLYSGGSWWRGWSGSTEICQLISAEQIDSDKNIVFQLNVLGQIWIFFGERVRNVEEADMYRTSLIGVGRGGECVQRSNLGK